MRALRPSDDSALVLVVPLPPGLEALRRRTSPTRRRRASRRTLTLLYPFAEPRVARRGDASGDRGDRRRARAVDADACEARRWPDALYATVEPDAPVRALQAELAAAFPSLPLYGERGSGSSRT